LGWGLLNFATRRGRTGGRSSKSVAIGSLASAASSLSSAAVLVGLALLLTAIAGVDTASAQTSSPGILATGNAIVTGFSGAPPPSQIAPGQDPGDLTFIDPNGPSAQVFNLQAPGAPPQAQVIAAPVPFTVTAAQVGQVFGVALDNATPPNMYVAATSAYGLPIVMAGQGSVPTRVHQGAPGATFMAGLFGPGGGPGSIWRIDGSSGAVTLFANVTLNGVANSGPALGGLAFDAASNSLLVADRQTGMVHRFNLSGTEIGRYDHGAQGLAAAGPPPVAYAPTPLDITSAQFSSDQPATWDYAPPERRIFGLAVHAGRLFYAVTAGAQIWSVSLAPDGSFGADARIEVQVPPALGPTEISKIAFDDRGDMLLAERAAPTGDYELMTLAQPDLGRVLRYAPLPSPPGGWQPAPDQYAIGFPDPNTNANGGVAVGFSYDANGNLDRASCGGFVWSTGEDLRNSANPNLANVLAANGSLHVNGLQGNGADLVKPANAPPLQSYFVDYDAQFDSPALHGYLGDIAIPRTCGQAALPGFPDALLPGLPGLAGPPNTPNTPPPPQCQGANCPSPPQCQGANCPSQCQAGTSQQPGIQCCPQYYLPDGSGGCKPLCPGGQTTPQSYALCKYGFDPIPTSAGNHNCLDGNPPNPPGSLLGCITQSPYANPANCPQGEVFAPDPNLGNVSVCRKTILFETCAAQGLQVGLNDQSCAQDCPNGTYPFPTTQCCPIGQTPGNNGQCPSNQIPPPVSTTCQQSGNTVYCVPLPNAKCLKGSLCCPSGSMPNAAGDACVPTGPNCDPSTSGTVCCPPGQVPQPGGSCGSSSTSNPLPNCTALHETTYCSPLQISAPCTANNNGCCPAGSTPTPDGCVATGNACPSISQTMCCPPNQMANFGTQQCCPVGAVINTQTGQCQMPSAPQQPPIICPTGMTIYCQPSGTNCSQSQKSTNGCCPTGSKVVAGGCVATGPTGCGASAPTVCCPAGQAPDFLTGKCLTPPKLWRPPGEPQGSTCAPGYTKLSSRICCLATQATSKGACCPAGQSPNADGTCEPVVRIRTCPSGETLNLRTNACETPACPSDEKRSAGVCGCPGDQELNADSGKCVAARAKRANSQTPPTPQPPAPTPGCAPGDTLGDDGMCHRVGATPTSPHPAPPPVGPPPPCPPGTVPASSVGLNGGGCVCPSGQEHWDPNYNQCTYLCPPNTDPRSPYCCPLGEVVVNGKCQASCLPGSMTGPNDACCPPGETDINGQCVCAPTQLTPNGRCCAFGTTVVNGQCAGPCPAQESRNTAGNCVPTSCQPGYAPNASGGCEPINCQPGYAPDSAGTCLPVHCPPNTIPTPRGCVPIRTPTACPPGVPPGTNGCLQLPIATPSPNSPSLPHPSPTPPPPPTPMPPAPKPPCEKGEERNADGACVPIHKPVCRDGEVLGANGACEKSEPTNCPLGEVRTGRGCEKESTPKTNERAPPRIEAPKRPPPKVKLPVFRPPSHPGKPNFQFKLPSRK
jgi:hypothetical protein